MNEKKLSESKPSASRFAYRKLIRDKILDSMLQTGQVPDYRVMEKDEYILELCKKLVEEAEEVDPSNHSEIVDSLADLSEVIDALKLIEKVTAEELAAAKNKKYQKYGGFEKRIYLESAVTPPDNPWYNYLKSLPERYPEINL